MILLHISDFRLRVLNCTSAEGSRTEMEHAVLFVPGYHRLADQALFTMQNVLTVTLELLRGEQVGLLSWNDTLDSIVMPHV